MGDLAEAREAKAEVQRLRALLARPPSEEMIEAGGKAWLRHFQVDAPPTENDKAVVRATLDSALTVLRRQAGLTKEGTC